MQHGFYQCPVTSPTACCHQPLAGVLLLQQHNGYCAGDGGLVRCFILPFCPLLLLFTVLALLSYLHTKANKTNENPKAYYMS